MPPPSPPPPLVPPSIVIGWTLVYALRDRGVGGCYLYTLVRNRATDAYTQPPPPAPPVPTAVYFLHLTVALFKVDLSAKKAFLKEIVTAILHEGQEEEDEEG